MGVSRPWQVISQVIHHVDLRLHLLINQPHSYKGRLIPIACMSSPCSHQLKYAHPDDYFTSRAATLTLTAN